MARHTMINIPWRHSQIAQCKQYLSRYWLLFHSSITRFSFFLVVNRPYYWLNWSLKREACKEPHKKSDLLLYLSELQINSIPLVLVIIALIDKFVRIWHWIDVKPGPEWKSFLLNILLQGQKNLSKVSSGHFELARSLGRSFIELHYGFVLGGRIMT